MLVFKHFRTQYIAVHVARSIQGTGYFFCLISSLKTTPVVYAETEVSIYDGSQRVMCLIFSIWNLFLGLSNGAFFFWSTGEICWTGDELKRMWKQSAYYPISTLSWNVHIERTCSRISRNVFLISKLSNILDLHERKMLYYGLIYPLLSYRIVA
jgi:hypothetical protein